MEMQSHCCAAPLQSLGAPALGIDALGMEGIVHAALLSAQAQAQVEAPKHPAAVLIQAVCLHVDCPACGDLARFYRWTVSSSLKQVLKLPPSYLPQLRHYVPQPCSAGLHLRPEQSWSAAQPSRLCRCPAG